jgi:hypothetical protein
MDGFRQPGQCGKRISRISSCPLIAQVKLARRVVKRVLVRVANRPALGLRQCLQLKVCIRMQHRPLQVIDKFSTLWSKLTRS